MRLSPLHARASRTRCPVCRDDLASVASSSPLVRCPACGVCAHGACARELERCATLGCARSRAGATLGERAEVLSQPRTTEAKARWTAERLALASFLCAVAAPVAWGITIATALSFIFSPHVGLLASAGIITLGTLGTVSSLAGLGLGVGSTLRASDLLGRVLAIVAALANALPWIIVAVAAASR